MFCSLPCSGMLRGPIFLPDNVLIRYPLGALGFGEKNSQQLTQRPHHGCKVRQGCPHPRRLDKLHEHDLPPRIQPANVDRPSMRSSMSNAVCRVYLAASCHGPGEERALVSSHVQPPFLQALRHSGNILQQRFGVRFLARCCPLTSCRCPSPVLRASPCPSLIESAGWGSATPAGLAAAKVGPAG